MIYIVTELINVQANIKMRLDIGFYSLHENTLVEESTRTQALHAPDNTKYYFANRSSQSIRERMS